MTDRRRQRIFSVLARRQPDLSVLVEDVYKPHNFSAILRSCDAVGVGCVHAVTPSGSVPTYNATSASAEKWVDVAVHDNVSVAISDLRAAGMTIYAAHLSSTAVDYREVDYVKPSVIVLGNEKRGVSDEAAARVDQHVIIPMMGMVQSLNVSVAAAVILFEAQRQRREAGHYDQPRLSLEATRETALRWLAPAAAAELAQEPLGRE